MSTIPLSSLWQQCRRLIIWSKRVHSPLRHWHSWKKYRLVPAVQLTFAACRHVVATNICIQTPITKNGLRRRHGRRSSMLIWCIFCDRGENLRWHSLQLSARTQKHRHQKQTHNKNKLILWQTNSLALVITCSTIRTDHTQHTMPDKISSVITRYSAEAPFGKVVRSNKSSYLDSFGGLPSNRHYSTGQLLTTVAQCSPKVVVLEARCST